MCCNTQLFSSVTGVCKPKVTIIKYFKMTHQCNKKMADSTSVQFLVLVVILQALISQIPPTYSRPYDAADAETECSFKPGVQELCQQCAKHTKSAVVYPMCCNNEEAAQDFCYRYLNFGLQ